MRRVDHLLLVGLGGAAGAVLRWAVGESISVDSFPWHTLLVNVVGCAALAVVTTRMRHVRLQRLLATGFCGGLTTFSTFSVEVVELLDGDNALTALAYFTSSLILGLLAYVATKRAIAPQPQASASS